jgi:hypothetical protein
MEHRRRSQRNERVFQQLEDVNGDVLADAFLADKISAEIFKEKLDSILNHETYLDFLDAVTCKGVQASVPYEKVSVFTRHVLNTCNWIRRDAYCGVYGGMDYHYTDAKILPAVCTFLRNMDSDAGVDMKRKMVRVSRTPRQSHRGLNRRAMAM